MRLFQICRIQVLGLGLVVLMTIGFTIQLLGIHFQKRWEKTLNAEEASVYYNGNMAAKNASDFNRTNGKRNSLQAQTLVRNAAERSRSQTPLRPVSSVPSLQSCQPKHHIVFLKTHKTAGSTILNLLHRYGDRNRLTFALPFKYQFNYPNLFQSRRVKGYNTQYKPHYDILCHHMRFNLPEVRKVMPPDSFYFTILRDPATMAESSFAYYRSVASAFKKAPTFQAFISNPSLYYRQGERSNHYARNLLWFDLGFNPDAPFSEPIARAGSRAVEGVFKLVLLAEYFDESMILLREALCWEIDDVVSFKLNIRGTSRPLQNDEIEKLRAWNSLDWYLYRYFNQTFWEKVESFGRARMDIELKKLRERRNQLSEICLESSEPVGAENIQEEAIKPFQFGQAKIMGWVVRTNLEPKIRAWCVQMVTPELQYKDLLHARQSMVGVLNMTHIAVTSRQEIQIREN